MTSQVEPADTRPVQADMIPQSLDAAFERTQKFSSTAVGGTPSAEDIQRFAEEEAAFGRIDVDSRCLTAGMRLHLLEPVHAVLVAWRAARAPFDQQLAPYLDKLDSIDTVENQTAELQRQCEREEAELERTLEADTRYGQIKERYEIAETRYKQKFAENDQRVPILWGCSRSYIVALAFTLIAELFINYDVFVRFLEVPAWAAATAVILGALLAFAAHGHGTLLKQWAFRFGPARTRAQRFGDWRFFALSTFGLIIVLTAAGGSRYAAVMRLADGAPSINLLGAEAAVDISPVRDVLISLLGNLGAWAVGVFWAYIGHDHDPEYMEAAHERDDARAQYNKFRKNLDAEKETVRARYAREISKKQSAANTFARDFEKLHNFLVQVREHESAILTDMQASLVASARRYHDVLVQLSLQQAGKISFVRGDDGQTISPYEFKNLQITIDPEFVRGLV